MSSYLVCIVQFPVQLALIYNLKQKELKKKDDGGLNFRIRKFSQRLFYKNCSFFFQLT